MNTPTITPAVMNGEDDSVIREGGAMDLALGQWYWKKAVRSEDNPGMAAWRSEYERVQRVAERKREHVNYDEYMKAHPRPENEEKIEVEYEWLGCVMYIGSNYLLLQSPKEGKNGSYSSVRVHFKDFYSLLRREENPEAYIKSQVALHQGEVNRLMNEIKEITLRLGVSRQPSISEQSGGSGTEVALLSSSVGENVKQYEVALIEAKDEILPELFEQVKEANFKVAKWSLAETMPMEAIMQDMESPIKAIKDRIFNVSLYAGLMEDIKQVRDGEPAEYHEKLHVMQRRVYMDEECLLAYNDGGMDIKNLDQFDQWLTKPENYSRILPYDRCLLSMRVRRYVKERDSGGSIGLALENADMARWDKKTFLYVRNGERLYRLDTELEFDEMIFPDQSIFDPSEPLMVRLEHGGRIKEKITHADWEERKAKLEADTAEAKAWIAANPQEEWMARHAPERFVPDKDSSSWMGHYWKSPDSHTSWSGSHAYKQACPKSYTVFDTYGNFKPSDWEPFSPDSVYFDDVAEEIGDEIKKYNRIATIIQGLFDRSECLHPHPKVRSWTPDGFTAAITLVYDSSRALHFGETPDFEAYINRCNASIKAGSIVIGQEDYWERKEAEKECARRDNDYRDSGNWRPQRYRPRGNPGPGYLAAVHQWKPGAQKATFVWLRERMRGSSGYGERPGDMIKTSIVVPVSELFNVSAYKKGDFEQFFKDPRTRAQYLKWAPMFLAAERYLAGELVVMTPVE